MVVLHGAAQPLRRWRTAQSGAPGWIILRVRYGDCTAQKVCRLETLFMINHDTVLPIRFDHLFLPHSL
jgi:hypothetical protein